MPDALSSWQHGTVDRLLVLAGKLSSSVPDSVFARRVTVLWLKCLLLVSQHGQLSLPSLRGQLMSSNPCYNGLRKQTIEGVVRGVVYHPRQLVLQPLGWSVCLLLKAIETGDKRPLPYAVCCE